MKSLHTIHGLVLAAFAKEPTMNRIVASLPRRVVSGAIDKNAKPTARSWLDDGEIRSELELRDAIKGPLKKALAELEIDPNKANAVVVATRIDGVIVVKVAIVRLGDVEKGEWASFEYSTEREWFAIANGPEPKRYPYVKMPNPIGTVFGISPDGEVVDRVEARSGHMEWIPVPLPWSELPGLNPDLEFRESLLSLDGLTRAVLGEGSWNRALADPIAITIADELHMLEPTIREIRKDGVSNGFRDGRGNVID